MFVSSYNTYINTNTSNRTSKTDTQSSKESSSSKTFELPKNELKSSFPVDYIAKSKTFNNQIELEAQKQKLNYEKSADTLKSKELTSKFETHKTLQSAKQAYTDNTKLFSIFKIPHASLDQTPKIDTKLPANIQELKEQNLRNIMVNTYIQNDKYYQITA